MLSFVAFFFRINSNERCSQGQFPVQNFMRKTNVGLGIQDFHRKYVLVPADKDANNVVVV